MAFQRKRSGQGHHGLAQRLVAPRALSPILDRAGQVTQADKQQERFTLIVPTYNRPGELARLLQYLENHQVGFPILVLDSSVHETQAANQARVQASKCTIRYERFDASVSPWQKFLRGAQMVSTPYCSLCADDDVVLPDSLGPIVQHLDRHKDCSVAHGWYFTFYDNGHIGITSSVYRGASNDDDDPLRRLHAMFRNYEAVTYGVYRTEVMQSVLADVQDVESMLGRELLGGALTIAHGKAARLPVFYYGRSHLPSHPYTHWHPLDFLISSPDGLYRDYAAYRSILSRRISQLGSAQQSEAELLTAIDLIHFRYLSDYVKPSVMDYLVEQTLAKTPKPEVMQGLWSVLARANDPSVYGLVSGSQLIRRLRDRYFPRIKLSHLRRLAKPSEARSVNSTTAAGQAREYRFYGEFLATLDASTGLLNRLTDITSALDRYE
jgi:glycosyltransferase domain-containing protein